MKVYSRVAVHGPILKLYTEVPRVKLGVTIRIQLRVRVKSQLRPSRQVDVRKKKKKD